MEQSEGKFLPVNGGIGRMFLTFLYLVVLASFVLLLNYFIFNPYKLGEVLSFFLHDFSSSGILFILIVPFSLAITIHKSFLKGLLALVISLSLFLFIAYLSIDSESYGYLILGIMGIFPILIGISASGILMRLIFRIKSNLIKSLVLVLPFVLVVLIALFTFASAQKPTISKCNDHDPSAAWECYRKFAQNSNNPEVCKTIRTEQFSTMCAAAFAIEKNNLLICDVAINDYYKGSCLQTLASFSHNSSICPIIQDETWRRECYRLF